MDKLRAIRNKYKNANEFLWVQEEPENMGAWPYICRKFRNRNITLDVVSRKESSSTATGYAKQHIAQQLAVVGRAFEDKAGAEARENVKKSVKTAATVDSPKNKTDKYALKNKINKN